MIYLVETNGNSKTDVYICLHTFILAGNIQNHLHGIRFMDISDKNTLMQKYKPTIVIYFIVTHIISHNI